MLSSSENIKLSLVIPCLNERETILKVVEDAYTNGKKYLTDGFEVVVADNGSTDGTLDILKTSPHPHRVVNVPVRGYGAALHWGICQAKGKFVLFGDADMSYPFSNLARFSPLLTQDFDLLLGSRLKGEIEPNSMPTLNRYFGTPVLTFLIRWIYNLPTTDCNSGMRIIRKDFYNHLAMRNPGMEWASELLIKTAIKKGKYLETPIDFRKDQRNRPPHLSRWADGWRHLKSIILNKPSVLYPFVVLLPAIGLSFIKIDFAVTFFFILAGFILALGIAANKLLVASIDDSEGKTSRTLKKFSTFQFVGLICLLSFIGILFISNEHLGTKLMLAAVINVVLIWLFFVETLKTFLVNRLPNPSSISINQS